MFRIGDQRVGIVTAGPEIGRDESNAAIYGPDAVVWVDGCLLEPQLAATATPASIEQQSDTTTSSEVMVCLMPVIDAAGAVPLVDDDGQPAGSMPFTDITSEKRLRDAATGRDYEMRGDAVHETGRLAHVFALCERQTG